MPTGDMGTALYLGDNRPMRAEHALLDHAAAKRAADNALYGNRLTDPDLTTCMVNRQTTADSGPGRAAVDLAFGENTDITRMGSFSLRLIDKDRSIKEAQICLEWMRNCPTRHDRTLDRHPLVNQGMQIVRGDLQVNIGDIDVCIKTTAEGKVITDLAKPRHIDKLVKVNEEGTF